MVHGAGEQLDITGSEFVQVQIREDGAVLWVHTAEGATVLRICQIKHIEVVDERLKGDNE